MNRKPLKVEKHVPLLWVEDYLKEKLWLASIQAKILKSVATLKENLLQRH